ncbi:uncharacterized protein Z520_03907 [Fonsecaea multimorphosa CBS 102226]|uniref:Uncharacterized protein n=1 Tax=Fonsecaea multimorphosa CBS 102226 TaxID=1442371 RepID=A0A0D2ITD0_9EURO|nr:uncharacterized protein Z520_03907 [Fonsecaea multimorphosa CBS 102226]KIY00222.1 hypothetical protein Z520_03907 [Fonsecaea multimorphosa CBS 102226]OAL27415.1 hypothetical protein AYO22_03690 [Fonsecaea multimorphosa]
MSRPPERVVREFMCTLYKRWLNLTTQLGHFQDQHPNHDIPKLYTVREADLREQLDADGDDNEEMDLGFEGETVRDAPRRVTAEDCAEYTNQVSRARKPILSQMKEYVQKVPACDYKTRATIAGE